MRNGVPSILLVLAAVAALGGCGGRRYARYQAQVEDQASVHLQCPIQHVHAEQVGEATWQVHACGAIVMYRCHRVPWVGMRCRRPGPHQVQPVVAAAPPPQPAPAPQATVTVTASPPPASPPLAAPRVVATPLEVLQVLGPALRQCGASGVVVVRWTADGTVFTSLDGPYAGTPADACVRALSAGVRVEAPGVEGTLVQEVW